MKNPMKTLFVLITFLLATDSFASNPGVSYQGRIFKPDGNALEGTTVQFRMQVRSPGSENCLLYEEVQTLNMAGSSGIFSLTMNDGTGTRLDAATYQVDRIFANRGTMTLDSSRCATGTDYTPNSSDGRKLIVYFKDETMAAYEAMPIMNLNYVPQAMYALEAQKVGTFAVNNILRAVDGSGNPVTAPALDPTQLTSLTNLLAGTSTQYATTTQFNTVQGFAKAAPPTCGANEVLKSNGTTLSCVTDSSGGSPSYSGITAATATNTIDNLNFAQAWNWSTATTQSPMSMSANSLTTGSAMNVTTSSASLNSTNGLLNIANTGASTSGILARFQSNSTAGSGLTVLANGNVGIGTATPDNTLAIVGPYTALSVTSSSLTPEIASFSGNGNPSITLFNNTPFGSSSDDFKIQFKAYNNNPGIVDIAQIRSAQTANGVGAHAGFLSFSTSTAGAIGERMRITETGNVGIGTASPAYLLNVVGSVTSAANIRVETPMANAWAGVQMRNGIMNYSTNIGTDNKFHVSSGDLGSETQLLTIVGNSGNVGIGITGPSTKLHVVGTSGATIATFADGGATTCTVTPASTGFACSSDERLKKNIESVSDSTSLENILQLRTVTYDWRSVDNGRHTGYIAQELEQVAPEFVRTGEDGFKQVNYTGLVPWITGAIKAFYAEFKALSAEVKASNEGQSREIATVKAEANAKTTKLEAENAELKARLDQQEKELAAIKSKLGL